MASCRANVTSCRGDVSSYDASVVPCHAVLETCNKFAQATAAGECEKRILLDSGGSIDVYRRGMPGLMLEKHAEVQTATGKAHAATFQAPTQWYSEAADCFFSTGESLVCAELKQDIWSLSRRLDEGWTVNSSFTRLYLPRAEVDFGRKYLKIVREGDLFYVHADRLEDTKYKMLANSLFDHRRYGHHGAHEDCVPCKLNKGSRRKPHKKKSDYTFQRFNECVSADLVGPLPRSKAGHRYFLTLVDHATRWLHVVPLKSKNGAVHGIEQWCVLNGNPGMIRMDNGGEFRNKEMTRFATLRGIKLRYTTPYSPAQNGLAESNNKIVLNRTRILLEDGKRDENEWHLAACCVAYTLNRADRKILDGSSSFEKRFGRVPKRRHMRPFGEQCLYAPMGPREGSKLANIRKPGVFVGYSMDQPCYLIMNEHCKLCPVEL